MYTGDIKLFAKDEKKNVKIFVMGTTNSHLETMFLPDITKPTELSLRIVLKLRGIKYLNIIIALSILTSKKYLIQKICFNLPKYKKNIFINKTPL